jgi:tetratricopeptide (TPR) repeat protein
MLKIIFRSFIVAMLLASWVGVCSADEVSDLKARVAALEKRVEELEKALKASSAKVPPDQLRAKQQAKARQRMQRDSQSYSQQELREIETLYQVANKKWRSPEAQESLKTLVEKYKKANRTGCAILYLGQMTQGDQQIDYLKQAIADHSDCFYGDGVQVGALARFFLANIYLDGHDADKALKLFEEIRNDYPDAVDHNGVSLLEKLPTVEK